jgi:hypothetical protein
MKKKDQYRSGLKFLTRDLGYEIRITTHKNN